LVTFFCFLLISRILWVYYYLIMSLINNLSLVCNLIIICTSQFYILINLFFTTIITNSYLILFVFYFILTWFSLCYNYRHWTSAKLLIFFKKFGKSLYQTLTNRKFFMLITLNNYRLLSLTNFLLLIFFH